MPPMFRPFVHPNWWRQAVDIMFFFHWDLDTMLALTWSQFLDFEQQAERINYARSEAHRNALRSESS